MLRIEVENRIRQLNPWITNPDRAEHLIARFLPPEYVNRDIEKTPVPGENRAMLITGPRQAGKSTTVWHILRGFSPDILFLNMEDALLRTGSIDAVNLVEHLQEKYHFIKAIFIDEIQHMEDAGLFVKGLADARLNIPIWVTGSSAYDLRSKTRESLAGRATRKTLLPFGMRELIKHASPPNPIAERHICEKFFSRQIIYGSYPSVWLADGYDKKIMLLNDLVESLILRDASDMFRIRRVDAFRKLLALLAGQIGNLVNFSEIASICSVDVGTINSYIEILDESHIVRKVLPYAEGKRREITGSPKVFFIDNGIRNQLLNSFSDEPDIRTDKGQLLENWVFTEINKILPFQSSLKFWRSKSKAEVDFVIEHAGKAYALEVKFTSLRETKLSRSARSFMDAYRPARFAVLNMTLEKTVVLNDTEVNFITPFSLLQWFDGIFQT
ncbi:MAG: ATP-binding protein [Desulfobacterales bacterium]|nr:ATP-binding protein [Desulfobacterales bacterium]